MSKPRIHPNQKLPNRFAIELESFRKFRFRERVKVFFGFNLTAKTKLLVDKRTGEVWSETKLALTDAVSAKAVIQDNIVKEAA